MMGVPPSGGSGRPPSRNESSQGPSQSSSSSSNKQFKLPKDSDKEKEDKKTGQGKGKGKKAGEKKDQPGEALAAVGEKLGQKSGMLSEAGKEIVAAESKGAEGVAKISAIIQKLVEKLSSGTLGSKQITSLDLKTTSDIPPAFKGVNLTVTQTDTGLKIDFSNFSDAKQQADAALLLKDNQGQLSELVRSLASKNITLSSLNVGNINIALPRPDEVTPAQPVVPPPETYQQQDQGQQQQQGQDQGESEAEE